MRTTGCSAIAAMLEVLGFGAGRKGGRALAISQEGLMGFWERNGYIIDLVSILLCCCVSFFRVQKNRHFCHSDLSDIGN